MMNTCLTNQFNSDVNDTVRGFKWWPLVAMSFASATYAATPDEATMYFCAKSALFAESFSAAADAGKSRQDSLAEAVAHLDSTFKDKVDEAALKLLLPWAVMADKLPGYKPPTKGSFVAVACVSTLRDAAYVPFQKAEAVQQVRNLLDACEAKDSQAAVGKCIKDRFTSLSLEKLDK